MDMENRFLIVVDMQNDFVTGSLGTKEAQAIVLQTVKKAEAFEGTVLFTLDTHGEDYLQTQEGKRLPVKHCIEGTKGWDLIPPFKEVQEKKNARIFKKKTFGSVELAQYLADIHEKTPISSIELIGLCTDICVVSNALLIKAYLPEVPILVDASCCAGVTPGSHEAALQTMECCQIQVQNR